MSGKRERAPAHSSTCRAAWSAPSRSRRPRYWAQTMAPPVAIAVKRKITSLLMESTRETPDMEAEPILETIMVSTMPMRLVSTCSMIRGTMSFRRSRSENINSAFIMGSL